MATVTYNYEVGNTVYHVTAHSGIREATVTAINIVISPTLDVSPCIKYTLQYAKCGQNTEFIREDYIFADIQTALNYYESLVNSTEC